MTVEAQIVTTLTSLVSGRIFPDVAPLNTTRPYITYQQIGGQAINYTSADTPNRQNGYFQINTWAATRTAAAALALQIEDAMRAATAFVATPQTAPIAQHEPDLNLYGTIQDFNIWSSR